MKRGKLLLVLVALLVVSSGTLIAVNRQPSSSSENLETVSTTETLIDLKKEDLKELTVIDGEGSLTFLPTEEGWDIKDAPSIPLDTSLVVSTCNSLLTISSYRTIDAPSLEEFGILENSPKVHYTLASGEARSLTLGNKTPDGNYTYATKDEDTSKAYLISTTKKNQVSSSLTRYRITSLDSFDKATFSGLEASGRELDSLIIQPNEDDTLLSPFVITSKATKPLSVNDQSLESLLTSLPSFSVGEFIADEVTDLGQYGLDDPTLHLKLQTVDSTDPSKIISLEYLWGNNLDEDSIYFIKAGTNSVYAMDSEPFYEFLKQLDLFNLSSKFVSLIDINNVESLNVAFGETSYDFSIKRAKEDPSNSESEMIETYLMNGVECDEDSFKSLYQSIIGVSADIDLTSKVVDLTGTPVATFTFNFLDGSHESYPFYAYDNQFYAHKVDDNLIVGCNIKQLNYAKEALSKVVGY